jgi:hypothetical protein
LDFWLTLLLYAIPGGGKTWFAASAEHCERTAPALLVSAAGNPQSIRWWERKPDTIVINELEDLNGIYDFFAAGQPTDKGIVDRLKLRPPYKTLIVDGMTELQRYTLALAGGYSQLPIGKQGRQLQIQEFNPVLEHTTRMARLFFGLADKANKVPVHVIITSLEWEKLNVKDQTTTIKPLLWGSGGTETAGYALAVGRVRAASHLPAGTLKNLRMTRDNSSVVFWRPQPLVVAKDQYGGRLGDYIVDPTIQKVVDLVYGKAEGEHQTVIHDETEEQEQT